MGIEHLVRNNVRYLQPFKSARSEFDGQAEIFLDANENPHPTPYNRYPDPFHRPLIAILSEKKGVAASSIIVGNGSDEIIDLLIRTFCTPGRDVIRSIQPSFGMYEVLAQINDVKTEAVELTPSFQLDIENVFSGLSDRHKLLFLCSPNNPTGNSFDQELLLEIVKRFPGIVVIDEAYIDFSEEQSMLNQVAKFENLFVLQTFSKAYGGAGIRVGVGYGSKEAIKYMMKIKPPYNVSSASQNLAIELLKDDGLKESFTTMICAERQRVSQALTSLGLVVEVFPSTANFILVRFEEAVRIRTRLIDQKIIVRDRSSLRLCENCLRITIGTPSENDILINALKNIDNEKSALHR